MFLNYDAYMELFHFLSLSLYYVYKESQSVYRRKALVGLGRQSAGGIERRGRLGGSVAGASAFGLCMRGGSLQFPSSGRRVDAR